jgi:N-acetylneuraminic acid mutarotase
LTVTGTNFAAGAVVKFNGASRTTTVVSSTEVLAAITAPDISTAGPYGVTVTNPSPGGGTSGASTFTVNPVGATPAFLFVPVTPCRIADTRNANGSFGGPALASGSTRSFPIPSSSCGIPSTAAAYSLNVTVVPNGALGYISMWPTGQAQPLVSTLNSLDGRIKSDAAIVPAGTGGAVSVFATDATNVILDINGYFVPTTVSTALAFYPVTPCRVADTRNATGALGGPSLVGTQVRSFPVLSACSIPSSAQAYSLNFTAIPQGTLGYLSVWPAGQAQPLVSTLNALTGTVTANAAIVPAGTGGAVNLFVTNNADMVIDINGYFAPPGAGGLSLYTLTPCRVLDSRQNGAPFSGVLNVNVTASGCGVPASAQAYVFNATVVPPASLGYVTLWPEGATQPLVSTLNAIDGSLTSNMAIVPAASGAVSAFTSNPTQLLLDISGYFAGSVPPENFTALTPTLTSARAGHTATLLPNGKVLLTGGVNGSPAEIYTYTGNDFTTAPSPYTKSDSITGYFTLVAPLADNLAAVNITSNILTYAFTDGGVNTINSSEVFPPSRIVVSTDSQGNIASWDLSLILGNPPSNIALFTCNGITTYLNSCPNSPEDQSYEQNGAINAYNESSPGTWLASTAPFSGALNTAELYDPTANTFTALSATMTTSRAYHTATLLPSGLVLITGGSPGSNGTTAFNTAELYNPTANTFTALSPTMTTSRASHTATLLPNGKVLLTGGFGGANGSTTALNSAELYDPIANTFTALSATMTTARAGHTATLLPNGKVLLTGGFNNSDTNLNTAELYDPTANTFTALTATMTSTRDQHTATALPNGDVLLTGGSTSAFDVPALNTAELYDPTANTFTALSATMTTNREFHTATLLPTGQVLITGGSANPFPAVLNTAEVYGP